MSKPATNAEVREAIRSSKRLQHLVYQQLYMKWMTRHARDTQQNGARMYCDCIFMEDGDLVDAYLKAVEVAAATPE